MNSIIVEVDTDGVLANMDGQYGPYIAHLVPDYTEEKYINGWAMPALNDKSPEAGAIVRQLFRTPAFIRSLPRFDGVEEGMNRLTQIPGAQTIVHTHILTEDAAEARREWLEELMIDADANFDIDICVGDKKDVLENPYVTIEDNINNLNRSTAKIKFLVRRCHNREFSLSDIVGGDHRYVVDSFYDAVCILEKLLEA